MPYKKGEGKTAIGLFIDGLDVKLAHLALRNKQIFLSDVKTVNLVKRLEERTAGAESGTGMEGLDLIETAVDANVAKDDFVEAGGTQSNGEVIVSLLSEYPTSSYQLVYSISEPSIYYQTFEDSFGLQGSKLVKKLIDELSAIRSTKPSPDALGYITAAEGQVLSIVREDGLGLLDVVDSVKDFLGKRMPRVGFIETSDISMMNLVRANYDLGESELSIIVYVGTEFSRLIFMKGEHFFHFAPIISEGRLTPNIENTLYSRILLEQDSAGIPRIDRVFLAGEAHKIDLKTFFAPQFAEAPIEYLSSTVIDTSEIENGDVLVSEYAVPIAAAMRALDQKNPRFYKVDLLPTSFREGQKIFKLAWHGYVLLGIIFLAALFFTSRFAVQSENVRRASNELRKKQEQLAENKRLQGVLDDLTAKNQQYTSALAVYDSIVPNYNRWSKIFYHLTNSVEDVNSVWIKDINSKGDSTIELTAYSMQRSRIPRIANMFEKATLQSVEIENIRGKDVYRFSLIISKLDSDK